MFGFYGMAGSLPALQMDSFIFLKIVVRKWMSATLTWRENVLYRNSLDSSSKASAIILPLSENNSFTKRSGTQPSNNPFPNDSKDKIAMSNSI
jgi:hypothetical protein